jgi:CRISPR-associated protein Cas8a1/Csx13
MAKVATVKKPRGEEAPAPPLVLGLGNPGMTSLLRAGLGGLAASLRAIFLEANPTAHWPAPVRLGPGTAVVEPRRITFDWGEGTPDEVLRVLFDESFRLFPKYGVIELRGATDQTRAFNLVLAMVRQSGLKKTFLQHGSTTKKDGGPKPYTVEIDEKQIQVQVQSYTEYVHQTDGHMNVCEALRTGSVDLVSWAYPGAAERHVGLGATKCSYGPSEALAACFSLVGCLSFEVPRSGGSGTLVIVEPENLVQFAITRPLLAPADLKDAYVTGPGDAVLAVQLAIRMHHLKQPGVAATHAVMMKVLPWASQLKSRTSTVSVQSVPDERLDLYEEIRNTLPNRIRESKLKEKAADAEEEAGQGFFAATSALRAFATENVAAGRKWFVGFATATTGGKKPRFIHYFKAQDAKNLGALYAEEKTGLIAMTEHLDHEEAMLVRSVHTAIRQRFGAIAEETENAPSQTRKNRWSGERDRWRLAFAGAKTPEQIRAALADLWSRAGPNRELQQHWEKILPLLRPAHWETARDLALVALASYQGNREIEETESKE